MRIGKNPYKGERNNRPQSYVSKDVLCCMLVYIPNLNGYFKDRFEVMKICLTSLILHTDKNIADILVFDQGSCQEVIDYLLSLKNKGLITYLYLSNENLGCNGAKNYIYSICQGEFLCYSDDDVFFYPGWLEKSLEVIKNFPDIGIVSASPVSNKFLKNNIVAASLPNKYKEIETIGGRWDDKWDELFMNSLGNANMTREEHTIPLYVYHGVEAFPVHSHFQYLINKKARMAIYPFKVGLAMSSSFEDLDFNMEFALDKRVDDLGIGKLSTNGMYTEHLGGSMSERTRALAFEYKISNANLKSNDKTGVSFMHYLFFRFMNIPYIGKLPYRMYDYLFKLINEKKAYDRNRNNN